MKIVHYQTLRNMSGHGEQWGHREAYMLLVVALAVRLVLAAIIPLVPDEAYYWEWSRHLAFGYFDHPPVIAFLIHAGTVVFGDSPFGVRVVPAMVGFLGCFAGVALARRLGGERAAWRTALVISVIPLAAVGLIVATPDTPLLAGGSVLLWAVGRALSDGQERAGSRSGRATAWVVAGVALGLAIDSKYTAVLIPAGVALALVVDASLRREWLTPGPYLAIAVAGLLTVPVLEWNAAHGWISFTFQMHHGLGGHGGSTLMRELSLVGSQAALLSPILFMLLVAAVWRALWRPVAPMRFLLAVVAAFITLFFVWSARHSVSPNWLAPAVLPAIVVLATSPETANGLRWERWGVGLAAAMTLVIYVHGLTPILPLRPRGDAVAQAFGWQELATAVEAQPATWVAADRYQDAAELAWHLPGHPDVFSLNLGGRANQYDLWPRLKERIHLGDSLAVVLDDNGQTPPAVTALGPHFASYAEGALVEMHRGRTIVARRRIWRFFDLTSPMS